MNRLAQFLQYTQKVFDLKRLLRSLRDGRSEPVVPILSVSLCLVLGVVTRISSYLGLAEQTKRPRWRRLCRLKGALGDDIFPYVTERMQPEDWRQNQAEVVQTLKGNKALESCKIKGLLWVSLDANEHFQSRSRCCRGCCQRQVEVTEADGHPVRLVRSEEQWVEKRVRGGRKEQRPRRSQWVWGASAHLGGYAAEVVYQAGHRRWGIENKAFNELTQAYHLEHCYHHDPTSMLVQMLILALGFTLFNAFALHSQLVRWGELTLKALAHQLDLAREEDLPWDQRFHSG